MTIAILHTNQEQVTMSSIELVEYINSQRDDFEAELRHDHFMSKVIQVLGEAVAPNFRGYYKASNGKQNPMYTFPKREACLMAMSYSYDLQAKVFDKMTALEAKQAAPAIPKSLSAALRLAADQADQIEAHQAALAIAAPKVAALDRIAGIAGSITIREAAKDLQIKPLVFSTYLKEHGWIFKQGRVNLAYQPRIDAGLMIHKITPIEVEGKDGVTFERQVTQPRITPKGLAKLAVAFSEVVAH